jgi:S-methylmethionine-dependent homocysteine/selenocysteine methylase
MARYRDELPQLTSDVFLTDGGIETTLIFDDGLELPDFAAFHLFAEPGGEDALRRYFDSYAGLAARDGVGIVLETPTWRANPDWGARLGYDAEALAEVNRRSVALLAEIRDRHERPDTPVVISGCLGPRGDGYDPGTMMTVDEARGYHAGQIAVFDDAGADLVTAITMNYLDEAIGIVQAAEEAGVPVVVSFTVETDGALPTGQPLGEAIAAVDAATRSYAAYYMINCAHPSHFDAVLAEAGPWKSRIRGLRANASRRSHAELDEAEELDRGDPDELAAEYRELRLLHDHLTVLGGCCGTDVGHLAAISAACATGSGARTTP